MSGSGNACPQHDPELRASHRYRRHRPGYFHRPGGRCGPGCGGHAQFAAGYFVDDSFVTGLLDLSLPIEQVNSLAGHKSMAMTKRYDHANEERYGAAIEALDAAGKTSSAEALAAARWKQT